MSSIFAVRPRTTSRSCIIGMEMSLGLLCACCVVKLGVGLTVLGEGGTTFSGCFFGVGFIGGTLRFEVLPWLKRVTARSHRGVGVSHGRSQFSQASMALTGLSPMCHSWHRGQKYSSCPSDLCDSPVSGHKNNSVLQHSLHNTYRDPVASQNAIVIGSIQSEQHSSWQAKHGIRSFLCAVQRWQ